MKIGLIGYGYWGGGFVARNIARVADLAVIVDPDPSRMVAAAAQWTPWGVRVASEPEVAFRECDAVWIATPVETHSKLVREALEMGCDVMCEKPFVLNEDEAADLCAAAESGGQTLMVGHLSLFTSCHARAGWAVEKHRQGKPGEPVILGATRYTDRPSLSDKSVTWGLGPHDVAAMIDLLGRPTDYAWSGNQHSASLRLSFDDGWGIVWLDWLCNKRERKFTVAQIDYAGIPDSLEPLFCEARSFVEICRNGGPKDRQRQRDLAQWVTETLAMSEVYSGNT